MQHKGGVLKDNELEFVSFFGILKKACTSND